MLNSTQALWKFKRKSTQNANLAEPHYWSRVFLQLTGRYSVSIIPGFPFHSLADFSSQWKGFSFRIKVDFPFKSRADFLFHTLRNFLSNHWRIFLSNQRQIFSRTLKPLSQPFAVFTHIPTIYHEIDVWKWLMVTLLIRCVTLTKD